MEVEEPEPGMMRTQDRPQTGWEDLDDVFEKGVRMPIPCRPGLSCISHAVQVALEKRQQAVAAGDATGEVRAWKLFLLLPFMLRRPIGEGRVRKEELSTRFDKFSDGQWGASSQMKLSVRSIESERPQVPRQETAETRGKAACQKTHMGEVSRARQYLTGAALAPRNDQTPQELQRRRDQEVVRPFVT